MLTSFYELWNRGFFAPTEIPQTTLSSSTASAFPFPSPCGRMERGIGDRKGKDHRLRESNLLETPLR